MITQKTTRLIPFVFETDADANLVCKGVFKATAKGYWNTKIVINPINIDIIESNCDCPDCAIRGNFCKHLTEHYKQILEFQKEIGL